MYIYTPLCRYWITLYRYVLVFIVPHVDIELEDNKQFISNIPRIYLRIKFKTKHWSDLCDIYSKVIFLEFLSKKIFFTFLCWIYIIDASQQDCENFRKNDLLKICLQVTYPTNFCIICIYFYYWKRETFNFWKNKKQTKTMTKIKLFAHRQLRQMVLH